MTRIVILGVFLLAACSEAGGDVATAGGRPGDSAGAPALALGADSGTRRDSATGRDRAAPRDSQPYDPPCMASYLGLPCRQP